MPDFSILSSPAPYHLIAYGTLLGSEVFQSFIGGIVAFRALPRPQFSSLQQAIFPIYFSMQTALPVVLAITYPGSHQTLGASSVPSGLSGFLAEKNRGSTLVPIMTIFITSMANMLVVGPATTRMMRERKHQETRDGKKSYDSPPHSKEMMRMNKSFGRLHGLSSLLNMVGLLATMWYGVSLAERIQ